MRYLITPMQPTPNGRMHIGHGGGTYLRADVLARALRADGHEVMTGCGSDGFENWVLAAALQDGSSPAETVHRYDQFIRDDLRTLDIDFDDWVNPLSERDRESYENFHRTVFGRLLSGNRLTEKSERVPYSELTGLPLVGTFIAGACPACGANAGGSSCTVCGQHFQPDQLQNPRSRLSDETIVWRRDSNWFLQPQNSAAVIEAIEASGVDQRHCEVARRYVGRTGGEIRISGPGTWGISDVRLPEGRVLHNSFYLYAQFIAWRVIAGSGGHPTGLRTIGVYGSDNTTPGLVAPHIFADISESEFAAFDYSIINGMLDLDGEKCSTSKRHGIWLNDLQSVATSDEIRIALCAMDLESGRADLITSEFVLMINRYRTLVLALVLNREIPELGHATTETVEKQKALLSPENFRPSEAADVLWEYLGSEAARDEPPVWFATLAVLSEAITPRLSRYLRSGREERLSMASSLVGTKELDEKDLEQVISRSSEHIAAVPSTDDLPRRK